METAMPEYSLRAPLGVKLLDIEMWSGYPTLRPEGGQLG